MHIFHRLTRSWAARRHEWQAQSALAQDQFPDAARHARAFCALEPDNPHANFLMAQVFVQEGRPAEALAHLEQTAHSWPDDAPTAYAIGVCHDYLDETPAAIEAYRRTLRLAPHWVVVLKHLGRCCWRVGDTRRAERALTRYCEEVPEDTEAHDLLGYVSYREGHLRLAYGHYAQASHLDPRNPQLERNARLLYRRSATS